MNHQVVDPERVPVPERDLRRSQGVRALKYVSTRGEAPVLGFSDVLLTGLARDGGLYVPESWPAFTAAELASMWGKPYTEVAFRVISRFTGGEIADDDLKRMIKEAYATFRHEAVAPLSQIGHNHYVLELFHGPTLAFKDVAMQLLSRLMDHALAAQGKRATIVAATSGDTGGAAIEAFRGRERVDVFVLFPHGRVSSVQRRQMTTVADANVHAMAVEGTFDDAQAIVKGMFNHFAFRDRVALSGVNSINWARIVAQVVYYFPAAVTLGSPHRPVSFTVPTGNFGDIFAGYVAQRMGLPIQQLVIATNVNDILDRTLKTGTYEVTEVQASSSPSMDIQVSSNFERLLFEAYDRDGGEIRRLMSSLSQTGAFTVDPTPLTRLRGLFSSGRADETQTRKTIAEVLDLTGQIIDPHTAVAVSVARSRRRAEEAMVTLSTAHPAKFPDAVRLATGVEPPLPPFLSDLMSRRERYEVLPNDLIAVERFIEGRTRALSVGSPA
jgi:threonine synthase